MADHMSAPRSATNPAEAEEMAKYGIVLVPVDYFHYGKFRYTNLKDAIAQAKREHPSS
jgi:thiamine monophosphate synthase